MFRGKRSYEGRVVRRKIRIRATPEDVYAAWADPKRIARWFVDRAEGEAAPGRTVTWHFDEMDVHVPVPIRHAVPGELFLASGKVPGRLPFVQEVTIRREGEETTCRLIHSGFDEDPEWDEEYQGVDSGWCLALATLKYQLENYPDQDRKHILAIRPAVFEYESLQSLYTTAEGLESWLAAEAHVPGGELVEEAELSIRWPEGGELSGHVLARSGRELLLSWMEREAVLGLKCFSMGPGARAVGLDFSSWSEDSAVFEGVESKLVSALDRLLGCLAGQASVTPAT